KLDGHVLSLDATGSGQAVAESVHVTRIGRHRPRAEKANHGQCRLLRARSERPRGRPAAEQRNELAAFHSITSSARVSMVGGTSRPSAFAVFRLITSSYLVGACTGRSAGFSPFRMRST